MNMNDMIVNVTMNSPLEGYPSSFNVRLITAQEMILIFAMGKWEDTAPPTRQVGMYGGTKLKNSQQARLQYLLNGIGVHDTEKTYATLAVKTRNHKTMDSKITTHMPVHRLALNEHWYLDCCLTLGQKLEIVEANKHLGFSQDFIEIAKRFIKGLPIAKMH